MKIDITSWQRGMKISKLLEYEKLEKLPRIGRDIVNEYKPELGRLGLYNSMHELSDFDHIEKLCKDNRRRKQNYSLGVYDANSITERSVHEDCHPFEPTPERATSTVGCRPLPARTKLSRFNFLKFKKWKKSPQ